MRADRLLSLLMLLQSRGQMTAGELAQALEVSERTIYRDVDALCAAGVPIYAETGRDGGYALLDSYRTTLTGLTEGEVRALFMLSIPAPLAELGVSQHLKAALLKLSAALPESRRQDEERVRQRFYLDSSWWHQGDEPVPYLQTIHQAVWEDRKLQISYRLPFSLQIQKVIDPYGLVAKSGLWYLVYAHNQNIRVHKIADLLEVCLLPEHFEHPAGFDLASYWRSWCAEREKSHSLYPVTIAVAPDFLPILPWYFGNAIRARITEAAPADEKGWVTLTLSFESLEAARDRILSFGGGVRVVEPLALRLSLADYAAQIVDLYTDGGADL
jgi:predicted DNA-binding transcriptional regulator YafY